MAWRIARSHQILPCAIGIRATSSRRFHYKGWWTYWPVSIPLDFTCTHRLPSIHPEPVNRTFYLPWFCSLVLSMSRPQYRGHRTHLNSCCSTTIFLKLAVYFCFYLFLLYFWPSSLNRCSWVESAINSKLSTFQPKIKETCMASLRAVFLCRGFQVVVKVVKQ